MVGVQRFKVNWLKGFQSPKPAYSKDNYDVRWYILQQLHEWKSVNDCLPQETGMATGSWALPCVLRLSVYSIIDFKHISMSSEVVGSLSKHQQLYALNLMRKELVFPQTFDTILPFVGNLINDHVVDKVDWRARTLFKGSRDLKAKGAVEQVLCVLEELQAPRQSQSC